VTGAWRVGDALWLGIAAVGAARPIGSLRLVGDRAAADRAEAAALAASERRREECAVSRSHTEGVGAVLVGPRSTSLGVDIVAVARVSELHARAVVNAGEWDTLAGYGTERAALAWALKEAAAKATGEPSRWFPAGLGIVSVRDGLAVTRADGLGPALAAGWMRWSRFLCAWVRA
jgi:hypothetical protein